MDLKDLTSSAYWRVLQQDQRVWDPPSPAQPDELPLQLPTLRVRRQTGEPPYLEGRFLGRVLLQLHARAT